MDGLCLHILSQCESLLCSVACIQRQAPASHTQQAWMWRLYIRHYCQSHIHLSSVVHPVLSVKRWLQI